MNTEKIVKLRATIDGFCRQIRVVQGDTGRTFRFVLEDMTMDGSEQARIYVKKPDGKEVYNDCEVVAPNEVLMENDSGQIFAVAGTVPAEIQISKGGKTITSYAFEFKIEKSLTRAGAIQSSSEYGALETALAKAEGFYNPTFSEASARNNINSGESIPTLFGKIKKWFTDLNALIKLVGSTDISAIADGTVTKALVELNSKAFPMSKTKYYYGYPIDFHSMEDGIYWVEIQSNIAKNNPTTSNGSYIQLSTKLDGVGIFISRNDGQLYIQYKKNGIWNDWITYLSK